jgi:hypothetical protein
MGRSENSRNRIFGSKGTDKVFTEAANPAKVKDPSLIIYNAMNGNENFAVVSNGDHTDKVFSGTSLYNLTLDLCLSGIKYEPDAPNFTPRITRNLSQPNTNQRSTFSTSNYSQITALRCLLSFLLRIRNNRQWFWLLRHHIYG